MGVMVCTVAVLRLVVTFSGGWDWTFLLLGLLLVALATCGPWDSISSGRNRSLLGFRARPGSDAEDDLQKYRRAATQDLGRPRLGATRIPSRSSGRAHLSISVSCDVPDADVPDAPAPALRLRASLRPRRAVGCGKY